MHRTLLTALALPVGFGLVADRAMAQEARADDRNAVVATDSLLPGAGIVLLVNGMSCPFCAAGLEKRLLDLAAVDTTVVRVSDGMVLIRTKAGYDLSDEAITETVRRSGFSLREIHRRTD